MFQKLKRKCRPTTILLAIGFSISIMSVLVGISAINDILTSLAEADQEIPIFNTMQNTGISLALSIYLFSIANCLVVTNYWIITKRRDMAIRKAFGWSNYNLICAVVSEMAEILLVSLCIGFLLIEVFSRMTEGIISIHITPFFLSNNCLIKICVANCNCKRVCSIVWLWNFFKPQNCLNHKLNLGFLCPSISS